ncbi:MAG: hypothetical protein VXW22_07115, partial [Pseudomonadota bacterium]|nr:hypothetical protein [Pseudomonadota bacterium]
MRQSVFDFIDNLDTLLAVIIGALLATGGAMVAERGAQGGRRARGARARRRYASAQAVHVGGVARRRDRGRCGGFGYTRCSFPSPRTPGSC